jgi:hypothetical protein
MSEDASFRDWWATSLPIPSIQNGTRPEIRTRRSPDPKSGGLPIFLAGHVKDQNNFGGKGGIRIHKRVTAIA